MHSKLLSGLISFALLLSLAGCDFAGPDQTPRLNDIEVSSLTYEEFVDIVERAAETGRSPFTVFSSESEEPLTASEYLDVLQNRREAGQSLVTSSHFARLFLDFIYHGSGYMYQSRFAAEPAADLTLEGEVIANPGFNPYTIWSKKKSMPNSTNLLLGTQLSFTGCAEAIATGIAEWNGYREGRHKTEHGLYCV